MTASLLSLDPPREAPAAAGAPVRRALLLGCFFGRLRLEGDGGVGYERKRGNDDGYDPTSISYKENTDTERGVRAQ